MTQTKDKEYYFGSRKVSSNEKTRLVRQVFSSVADKYDIMNDLMSLGIHRIWKKTMIEQIDTCTDGSLLVDFASGTGDIAHLYHKRQPNHKDLFVQISTMICYVELRIGLSIMALSQASILW